MTAQNTLSLEDFLQKVKENHPTAKQAQLLSAEAKAVNLFARGFFDPKVSMDWQGKSFAEKNYFQIGEYGIKSPLWFGADLKAAYKTANGDFLNPEEKLPKIGQAVLGISMPLLQGLRIDERRGAIFKARVTTNALQNEQKILLNNLIYDAAKTYLEWNFQYEQNQILKNAVELTKARLDATRQSAFAGDKPFIDTLETFIQLQERLFDLNESNLDLQNAQLQLNNFLWTENQRPQNTINQNKPLVINVLNFDFFQKEKINDYAKNHIDYQFYLLKINDLEIERRLKLEKLKPKLNVDYNFLGNGLNLPADILLQNYRLGVHFSMPILLRQERGNLQLADLKLTKTALERDRKLQEITQKIQSYYNDFQNNEKQIKLFESIFQNYKKLLDAENQKFNIGESSVFLLNSRERKVIETEVKVLKLKVQQQKNNFALRWAMGILQ